MDLRLRRLSNNETRIHYDKGTSSVFSFRNLIKSDFLFINFYHNNNLKNFML